MKKGIRDIFSKNKKHKIQADEPSPEKLFRALNPPHDDTQEILHGVTVKDPFRPLEKLDAPETVAWVARENKKYEDVMRPAQDFEARAFAFLQNAHPSGLRETMPTRHGDNYAVYRKAQGEERWSLYIKDVPDYGADARLLLNPMQIDPSGKTNLTGAYFTRDGKTLAYTLNVSGSDKGTLHFMDVATGKETGPVYNNFRSGVNWDRDGKGFHYGHSDDVTKSREVRYHKIGTAIDQDSLVYAPKTAETQAGYFRLLKDSKDELGAYEYLSVSTTEPDKNAILARPLGSDSAFKEIFPHKEGTLSPMHEIGGKIYAETTLNAPNGKLVCFDINDPAPEKWRTILPENTEDVLEDTFIWQNNIFATYKHDTGEVLKVFDLEGVYLHDVPVPPLSTFTIGSFRIEDKTCLMTFDNFQESGGIYKYDSGANTLALYKDSDVPINLKDCVVERIHATSKDGTKVPMTVIRSPDVVCDGTAATLLYGYGGFGVSLDPGFSAGIAQWVREGGIYVQANLRGGGEYGQAWHDAGRGKNKQNVFEDFIACSEHLIKQKYTSKKRLGIQGGSNGGLLALAAVVQKASLFGAVVPEVPVADMFRFHIGSYYGFGWKSDYGDPEIKEDFNVVAKYSPLHNVKKGFKHPPILIKTDAHDDRVLPWHSYKMAATLQTREDPSSLTILKTRTDGGHSAGMTEKQWDADTASVHAFLESMLGPIAQPDYKAWLKKKKNEKKRGIFQRKRK